MKKLVISKEFQLPLDAVTQTVAVLARKGAGKTNTSVVIVEELIANDLQVVVVDPLDCWWGLRSSADGKSAGLQVIIIGGEHSDLPLYATSGELIADFLVDTGASAVLSVRHLSKTEQRTFVAAFCERLYALKGKASNRTPMHLVIDEADEFIPQKIFHGTERCFGAVDMLVRRGRSSGIGVTMISQRAAVINKDCLTQTECLIALQTTSPQDRKAIETWIEAHDIDDQRDEFMKSLASLPVGMAWIWSPSWLKCFEKVQIRRRNTFDSSATPKVGEKLIVPKRLAEVDIESLKTKLAATIEQKKADDPRELKKKIAELEKQLRGATQSSTRDQIAAAEQIGENRARKHFEEKINEAEILGFNQACRVFEEVMVDYENMFTAWHGGACMRMRRKVLQRDNPKNWPTPKKGSSPTLHRADNKSILPEFYKGVVEHSRTPSRSEAALGRCERNVLIALAQYPQGRNKNQVAVIAGYAVNSGGFNNALSRLRQAQYIEGSGDCLKITKDGIHAVGEFDPLPTGDELVKYWNGKLGRCEREVLNFLHRSRGLEFDKSAVAEATRYAVNSGGFNNALSKLRTLELIEGPGSALRVSENLV